MTNLPDYKTQMEKDTRYPYTYACDYIRSLAGHNESGSVLSRSDASSIMQGISKVLGIDNEEFASKMADFFKDHEEEIAEQSARSFMAAQTFYNGENSWL